MFFNDNVFSNSVVNGTVFSGSVVIQNGNVVTNGGGKGELKKYDERKCEEAGNIEKVTVHSTFVKVNVSVSKSSKVEAHLHGEANLDKELKFVVQRKLNEIKIALQYEGNCYGSNLELDVTIPKYLKIISIKTVSAGVELSEEVSVQNIKVETTSGKVNSYATFKKANISTISGGVKLNIVASEDISLKTSTISGKVLVDFSNVKNIKLSTSTVSGKVVNCHEADKNGYNADVDISTISGKITIN